MPTTKWRAGSSLPWSNADDTSSPATSPDAACGRLSPHTAPSVPALAAQSQHTAVAPRPWVPAVSRPTAWSPPALQSASPLVQHPLPHPAYCDPPGAAALVVASTHDDATGAAQLPAPAPRFAPSEARQATAPTQGGVQGQASPRPSGQCQSPVPGIWGGGVAPDDLRSART